MKEAPFYYLNAGFKLCGIALQIFWSLLCGVFFGFFSVMAFAFALAYATLKLIAQALFEILIEDWRDRTPDSERTDVPPFPRKPTPREIETQRLRREQKLIQKFKREL